MNTFLRVGMVLATLMPGWALAAADALFDGPDGVTCNYFNLGGKLPWRNQGGDWSDVSGTAQGNVPFSSFTVDTTHRARPITWDVTELVNHLRSRNAKRIQILVRNVDDGSKGNVALFSREAKDPAARPKLLIQAGPDTVSVAPIADAEINCTTVRGLGARDVMRAGQTSIVMEYPMPELPGHQRVSSAVLQLATTDRQPRRTELGVFRVSPPPSGWSDSPRAGIAVRYPDDKNLERHPSVVFVSRFESLLWRNQWSFIGGGAFDITAADRGRDFEQLQGAALRVNLAEGKKLGLHIGFRFREHAGGEPEEIYLRYYLRLGSDWNPTISGGKLPGISGTYDRAGWGGRKSDGTNGWSMRGSFLKAPSVSNPVHGSTPIGTYAYHADMKGRYGEDWQWTRRGLGLLAKNRWYCIEQYVKLNAPNASNGIMRAWIDGRLAFERTDVRFRAVPTLKIDQIWMNVYHGGTEPSPHDQHLYIDNVVVAREYVGPMSTGLDRMSQESGKSFHTRSQ